MSELNFTSLMDLAVLDTSEMSAQTSRLQKEGIYVVELKKIGFSEQPPQDPADPMNYNFNFESTILAFSPLTAEAANAEADAAMIGRDLKQRIFLYGKDIVQAIQLLMGQYKIVGFRHKGIMGGVEGSEPGWIDEANGQRLAVRVRHYSRKDGQEAVAYDWLSPKAMEKAGIPWEGMARPFLDEVGNEVQIAA
jgi:hypothetical protein